jgi:hypothetical protein
MFLAENIESIPHCCINSPWKAEVFSLSLAIGKYLPGTGFLIFVNEDDMVLFLKSFFFNAKKKILLLINPNTTFYPPPPPARGRGSMHVLIISILDGLYY